MAHNEAAPKHSLMRLLDMPQAFLGFALWRAWVSLTYANPSVPMPVSGTAGQFAYDVVLAGSAIVIALLSSRIAPLAGRRWVYGTIALLLGFSVAANVAALALPATTDALVAPATLAGGIGSSHSAVGRNLQLPQSYPRGAVLRARHHRWSRAHLCASGLQR